MSYVVIYITEFRDQQCWRRWRLSKLYAATELLLACSMTLSIPGISSQSLMVCITLDVLKRQDIESIERSIGLLIGLVSRNIQEASFPSEMEAMQALLQAWPCMRTLRSPPDMAEA